MRFVPALDEVVRPNICYEFSAWEKLDVELLLNFVEHLSVKLVSPISLFKIVSPSYHSSFP